MVFSFNFGFRLFHTIRSFSAPLVPRRIIISTLFFLMATMAYGQMDTAADQMDTADQKFVTHEVQPRETIYGICREYAIDQETLVKYNPQLADGLRIGQKLLIPVVERQPVEDLFLAGEAYLLHRVVKGNTIYSITTEYGVGTQQLYELNPDLVENGLQVGTLLKIPVEVDLTAPADKAMKKMKAGPKWTSAIRLETVPDSLKGNSYRIGLILPFYLQINDSLDMDRVLEEDPTVFPRSEIALDFYYGLRIALDTLARQGLQIELSVEDSEDDPFFSWAAYQKMADHDLIIGPLYSHNILAIADHRQDQGPLLVSPFSTDPAIVYSHARNAQVLASDRQMIDFLARSVIERFRDSHLFMVYTNAMQDTLHAALMREKFSYYLDSGKVREIRVFDVQIDGLAWLKDDDTNVVIVPSTDKVFMTDLITQLNAKRMKNVIVIGLPEMEQLDVDKAYFNNLNFHYPAAQAVNYRDSLVQSFLIQYRNRFHDEPSRFSIQGFDIGYFFGRMLMETGSLAKITSRKERLLQNGFDFRENSKGSYVNKHVFLMRYKGFERIIVR